MYISDEEIDEILDNKFSVYQAEVRTALFILSNRNELPYKVLLLELAVKIKKEQNEK